MREYADNPFPYVVVRWMGATPAAFRSEENALTYQREHAPAGSVKYLPLINQQGKLCRYAT